MVARERAKGIKLCVISGAVEGILLTGVRFQVEGLASIFLQRILHLDLMVIKGGKGFFVAIKENIFPPQSFVKKRLTVEEQWVVWNSHRIQERGKDIHVARWKVKRPRSKQGGLVKNGGCLQILTITVAVVHKIIGMVLAEGLAVVADDHKNGALQ